MNASNGFKIGMKRFSEELEVSGWEGFKPRETFNEKVIRWEIKINFGPTVFYGSNELPTPVNLTDMVKSQ